MNVETALSRNYFSAFTIRNVENIGDIALHLLDAVFVFRIGSMLFKEFGEKGFVLGQQTARDVLRHLLRRLG